MAFVTTSWSDRARARIAGVAAAALIQTGLALLLLTGLHVDLAHRLVDSIKVFDIRETPPPPPPAAPERPRPARHAPAPPAPKAVATPVIALPTPIIPPQPVPVVTALMPAEGADANMGAADTGNGSGAGGKGIGSGAGGEDDGGTPPRRIAGHIDERDYPRAAYESGAQGGLMTRYVIEPDGRISRCDIVESSGNAVLDDTTCRLAIKRFRFDPARDGAGNPVRSILVSRHRWGIER